MTDNTLIDETIETLSELQGICQDCEHGFRSSAEAVQAEDVRALLKRRAEECKASAEELSAHIARLGGLTGDSPRPGGSRHGWVTAGGVLPSHADLTLLQECERGEDEALERYADALEKPLEPAAKEVIDNQRMSTKRSHDQIRAMRDRIKEVG